MSSAAARAEARRKAILSRGSDRLAKLTTSARGEDASVYHDDPPLAQIPTTKGSTFVGEATSDMPVPRPAQTRVSASPEPSASSASFSTSASTSASTATSTTNANSNASNTRKRGTTPSRNANIFESLGSGGMATDPSVWLPEQQQQFMQALMNAASSPSSGGPFAGGMGAGDPNAAGMGMLPSPFGEPQDPLQAQAGEEGTFNALAALMGAPQPGAGAAGGGGMFPPFGGPGMGMGMGTGMGQFGMGMSPDPPKEKTMLQKLMPLLHLVAMWCLLAYFVVWAEPRVYAEASGLGAGVGVGEGAGVVGLWRRWAELGRGRGVGDVVQGFRVQVVPFFWAFTTLQIILHSLRIFSGFDAVHPPTLLALALPHLPQPLPSLVINLLKYAQMGGMFLDDLAGVLVGVGVVVWVGGWVAGRGEGAAVLN